MGVGKHSQRSDGAPRHIHTPCRKRAWYYMPPQRDVQRVRPGTTSCPRNDSVSEDSTFYFSALLGGVDYFHIPLLFQFPILASAFQFVFPFSSSSFHSPR